MKTPAEIAMSLSADVRDVRRIIDAERIRPAVRIGLSEGYGSCAEARIKAALDRCKAEQPGTNP